MLPNTPFPLTTAMTFVFVGLLKEFGAGLNLFPQGQPVHVPYEQLGSILAVLVQIHFATVTTETTPSTATESPVPYTALELENQSKSTNIRPPNDTLVLLLPYLRAVRPFRLITCNAI